MTIVFLQEAMTMKMKIKYRSYSFIHEFTTAIAPQGKNEQRKGRERKNRQDILQLLEHVLA